jgi:GxxExxY protein
MYANENYLSRQVIGICIDIHRKLGPGLLESVYEEILSYELTKNNLSFERQKAVDFFWDEIKIDKGFRADFIVESQLITEIKSVRELEAVHYKQLLTYLKLTKLNLGLLINFNGNIHKNGIKRVVNGLKE